MTAIDIPSYIHDKFPALPSPSSITRLSGGEINHVYRVCFGEAVAEFDYASSVVVKNSLGVLASLPDVKFGIERQRIEARAMVFINSLGVCLDLPITFPNPYPQIITPVLYHHDTKNNVLIMQDVGAHPDLQKFLLDKTTSSQEARDLATTLGAYLSFLHTFTKQHLKEIKPFFENHAARALVQTAIYGGIREVLEKANIPADVVDHLTQRANKYGKTGSLNPETADSVLQMGDLWPGALMVAKAEQKTFLLDWEFADIGNPAGEVGHFGAYLYLLANFSPHSEQSSLATGIPEAFQESFLLSYLSNYAPQNLLNFLEDMQLIMGIDIILEAVKGRWSVPGGCMCKAEEKECFLVNEKGGERRSMCISRIIEVGIELLNGAGVLGSILNIDI
ncbi:kinase-like domain-containing protein [Endogone sp. FLAS-F59071]|nr:kinase-like domain-containing protein [Endogone sp. FLAS-F59071]|eukprot:RUS20649.1 kinase-like domain-containing protein [Endogone sp. FLAS-F59071]